MKSIHFGKRAIGNGYPVFFVAEIASNHDSDKERAIDLIYLAAQYGADAVKFQSFRAETIISRYGFEQTGKTGHQSKWKKDIFEVYQDASLPIEWTPDLRAAADQAGVEFFSTPYDLEIVDLLDPHVNLFKIGSGDITWLEMIQKVASKKKPVFLATGASTYSDVITAVSRLCEVWQHPDLVLMQCNTNYTGSPENQKHVNLNVLKAYQASYPEFLSGFSDHSSGPSAVLGAVTLGAKVVEKHFTDDRSRAGPDHHFAETFKTWAEMIDRVRELEQALGSSLKLVCDNEKETVQIQRRALYATRDVEIGETLTREAVIPLRPCLPGYISPYYLESILNRRVRQKIEKDRPLRFDDIG